MTRRRGFALMAVLSIIVAASAVALTASVTARGHLDGAQNRIDFERALWRANDCLERLRATVDVALRQSKREDGGGVLRAWRRLDRVVPAAVLGDCDTMLQASGARLDVNRATRAQLVALFTALHLLNAELLADRLRAPPQEKPIANIAELRRVPGFEALDGIDSVLGVDQGKLSVNNAPIVALATVPGFTHEVLERIAADREFGVSIADVLALAGSVSRSAADTIIAHYPEVMQLVTATPDAWLVTARGWSGSPARISTIEATLVLGDSTAPMIRRRLP